MLLVLNSFGIVSSLRPPAIPDTQVFEPFNLGASMEDVNESQDQSNDNRFSFVDELEGKDTLVGIHTRTKAAQGLGVSEGTVRTAIKSLQQVIPETVLVMDDKITELGYLLIDRFINRKDASGEKAVAAQWIGDLREALKTQPFYQEWNQQTETTSRFGSVNFLRDEAQRAQEKSSALTVQSKEALGAMKTQLLELKSVHSSLKNNAMQKAFDEGFSEEMEVLTRRLAGRIKARQAFSEALEEDPDLEGLL
jgi:hypothetical protein